MQILVNNERLVHSNLYGEFCDQTSSSWIPRKVSRNYLQYADDDNAVLNTFIDYANLTSSNYRLNCQ